MGLGGGESLLLLFILQDLVYCALSKCQRCQSNPPIKPNPCCWALPVFISADRRAQSPHASLHPPTHPFTHPSLNTPSHSPSLLCSLSLIDRFTPRCDIFYAIADASWFVWHAYLHPPATHRQMLCSSICVCVCFGFCAAFRFENLSLSIRLLNQSSICGLFISPSQQLSRVTVSRCSSAWLFFISANTFFCRLVLNCRVSSRGRLLLTVACGSCLVLIAF